MKNLFISIVLLVFTYNGIAQNVATDSLKQLVANAKQDTSGIMLYLNLARTYLNSNTMGLKPIG